LESIISKLSALKSIKCEKEGETIPRDGCTGLTHNQQTRSAAGEMLTR